MDFDMIGTGLDADSPPLDPHAPNAPPPSLDAHLDAMAKHAPQSVMPMETLLNAPPTPTHAMSWPPARAPAALPAMQPVHPSPAAKPKASPAMLHPTPQHSHHPHIGQAPLHVDDAPPIEPMAVLQCGGGLRYAEFCKEQAREKFKDMKKNELMQRGEFETMKRRKKGDTSMTPRQKYLRRLRMNQDSAAAARHAQEVYVQTLEKLVSTTEVEKSTLLMELQQLRTQNTSLQSRVNDLQSNSVDNAENPTYEDATACHKGMNALQWTKLVDMLTTPETASALANDAEFAQGNMGIQPARAV